MLRVPHMNWSNELAYYVTPKSGPMRPMETLLDANRALLDDLSPAIRRRPHWVAVKRLLLAAATSAEPVDIRLATDGLVRALEAEGWMTRPKMAECG